MLTPQEIDFLYEILDQVNVRGVEGKVKIVTIMNKLLLAKEPIIPKRITPDIVPSDDGGLAQKAQKPPKEAEETE